MERFLKHNADVILTATLFLATLMIFFPGLMSPDSISLLSEAATHVYNDWHPPLMAWTWHWLNKILFGPGIMLIFHGLLFAMGTLFFVRALTTSMPWRLLVIVLFYLFPPFLTQLPAIWKDVGMSMSFFAGSALALYARERQWLLGVAMIPIFYATGLRHNAPIALLPLCFWIVSALLPDTMNRLKKSLVALVVYVSIVGSTSLLNASIANGNHFYLFQNVMLHDVAGMTIQRPDLLTANQPVIGEVPLSQLQSYYFPEDVGRIIHLVEYHFSSTENTKLSHLWISLIKKAPLTYLSIRATTYRALMGLGPKGVSLPFFREMHRNPWGFRTDISFLADWILFDLFGPLAQSVFFKGATYAGLAMITALLAWWRKDREALSISLSGLFIVLAFFPTAPGTDFRYFYWPVLSSVMALLLLAFRANPRQISL